MNLLITSIGQRGYLIDHFKQSLGDGVGIFACDATKYAPGLQNADKAFLVPNSKDENYFSVLKDICLKHNVKAIVSINDLELPMLARLKDEFLKLNIVPIVSDEKTVGICFDKYETYKFCKDNNISVPDTYLWSETDKIKKAEKNGSLTFPLIAKPRRGSRSVGISLINSFDNLTQFILNMNDSNIPEEEKHIFQEYVPSDEYSLHVFNNIAGETVSVVGMVNLIRHFGETFHIKTHRDQKLISLGKELGEKLKHVGPISADVHKRENGEYVILEINPRISGCYSLSHFAGADFPSKIWDIANNVITKTDKIDSFKDMYMLKQFTTCGYSEKELLNKIED